MSDFAGIWRLDGRPIDDADINRLTQGLSGRGIQAPRLWKSRSFALVQRQHLFTAEDRQDRLPLASSAMAGPHGGILAGDIRVNDRDELAATLGLATITGMGDGALLLRALERWGTEAALPRLNGFFSFALWQPQQQRLILARDHCGHGTLYLHRGRGLIAFANRLRPLLALPEIPRDLDELALAEYLILAPGAAERTVYPAIQRLPMAHVAVITAETMRQSRWWELPLAGTLRLGSDSQLLEAAHAQLDRAVAQALRSEATPALALTGGLDTASVVQSAARQTTRRLPVFTRRPTPPFPAEDESRFYDEAPVAAQTAALHPMLDWQAVEEDGGDWGEMDANRWHLESGRPYRGLFAHQWFFPFYRAMEARGCRVWLSGNMGNFVFSFSGLPYLSELAARGHWLALAGHWRDLHRGEGLSWRRLASQTLTPFIPQGWLRRYRGQGGPYEWSHFSALSPDLAAQLRLDQRQADDPLYRLRNDSVGGTCDQWRRWTLSEETPRDANPCLRAMCGMDVRIPLLDRRLLEFFAALPIEEFLKGGWSRSLTRRMLEGQAPERVIHDHKRGAVMGDWHRIMTAQLPTLRARLERAERSPLASRTLDLAQLRTLLDTWPSDPVQANKQKLRYWIKLSRGLDMADFLLWSESGNH